MFGKTKTSQDPVPKGVKLGDYGSDPREIKIDALTAEILKQDINFIRDFYIKLVEKISENLDTVTAIGKQQERLDQLICKFGKTNDEMINKLSAAATLQEYNQLQIIKALGKIIDSQNQIIANQNGQNGSTIHSVNNSSPSSGETNSNFINPISPDTDVQAVSFEQPDNFSADNLNQSEDCRSADAEISHPVKTNHENLTDKNGDEQPSDNEEFDPQSFAAKLLKDITYKITAISGPDLTFERRDAEHLPGIQAGQVWYIALPPKMDGTYDSTVLQEHPFKIIRNLMRKKADETVVAVYSGYIDSKKLIGAQNSAKEYKIKLVSFADINVELSETSLVKKQPAV